MGITFPYELANGNTADADEVMANLNEIKNNFDQDTIEDASANATEFRATKLPTTGSLPTSGREEIKTLRYQLKAITGKTNWDEAPSGVMVDDTSAQTIAGAKKFTGHIVIEQASPRLEIHETDVAADNQIWELISASGQLRLRATNDAYDAFGDVFTVDRAGVTVDLFNILSTNLQHNGNTIVTAGAAVIGQGELKTATSSQSLEINAGADGSIALTGGSWSWWTAGAAVGNAPIGFGDINTAAGTLGFFNDDGSARTIYVDGRYIQASPPYKIGDVTWGHFFYVLRNKSTGEVLGTSEAEDPSWAYNGAIWIKDKNSIERMASAPHPFAGYWDKPLPDELEICLIDMREFNVAALKIDCLKKKKKADQEILTNITIGAAQSHKKYNLPEIPGFTDKVKIRKHN